jgi:predicted secreted Zn-dependent protease
MKLFKTVSTISALAACAATVPGMAADIQKWTDADGRVHYGDRAPPGIAAKEVRMATAAGAPPAPEVQVEETVIRTYEVSGASVRELNNAMRRTAPVSQADGERVWGHCEWRLNWDFTYSSEGGKCRMDKFSVKISAIIDFPKWTDRNSASESLQRNWDEFSRTLRVHEDGHKENGVRAANDLANRMRALPLEKDCGALKQKIKMLGERITLEYRYIDEAFDRATEHGASQGARLR